MRHLIILSLALVAIAAGAPRASAHCDTTSGPVVTAARTALDTGDPRPVLAWIQPADEPAVLDAFHHALRVRALGADARALADRYFFETVVRLHRAGEGAGYSGLSDAAPDPIIAATDRALAAGSADEVERALIAAVRDGLATRFAAARAASGYRPDDVAAGRAFVAAYVPMTHWIEQVYEVASEPTAADHEAATHGEVARAPVSEGPHHIPALLTWLLAVVALIEAAVLFRWRHHPAP